MKRPKGRHPPDDEGINAVGAHCPRCRAEYRPGFTVCADCGIALVPGPSVPETWRRPTPPEGRERHRRASRAPDGLERHSRVVTLGRFPWREAWLLAGKLRHEGITARVLDYESAPEEMPVLFEVLVEADQAEEARRIAVRYLKR